MFVKENVNYIVSFITAYVAYASRIKTQTI